MQTATDYIFEQLEEHSLFFSRGVDNEMQISISASDYLDMKRLAKEMEKDNTIAFGYRCIGEVDSELGDLIYKKVPEEVYNDTYGSKGSDEHIENNLGEIISKAHTNITKRKGKEYAPTSNEIQAEIEKLEKE